MHTRCLCKQSDGDERGCRNASLVGSAWGNWAMKPENRAAAHQINTDIVQMGIDGKIKPLNTA